MVTYNGETTNFSGPGSPNPIKLVIPGKDKMEPAVATAMLAIEQWCNNLIAPSSGGGGAYDSLTGPGETATPGYLEQAGSFGVAATGGPLPITGGNWGFSAVVTGVTGTAMGIDLKTINSAAGTGTNEISMTSSGGISISTTTEPITIGSTGAAVTVGGTSTLITSSSTTSIQASSIVNICSTSGKLSFYQTGAGHTQQTIVGSKAGNVALANLLTALQNIGLVIDSTT